MKHVPYLLLEAASSSYHWTIVRFGIFGRTCLGTDAGLTGLECTNFLAKHHKIYSTTRIIRGRKTEQPRRDVETLGFA